MTNQHATLHFQWTSRRLDQRTNQTSPLVATQFQRRRSQIVSHTSQPPNATRRRLSCQLQKLRSAEIKYSKNISIRVRRHHDRTVNIVTTTG